MSEAEQPGFSIFGSCVTRDVFGFSREDRRVGAYIARSTIASAVAPQMAFQLDVSAKEGETLSPFELRMVETDVRKSWLRVLAEDPSPALIVDLIDERFSVIAVDEGMVTESASLTKVRAHDQLVGLPHSKLDFFSRREIDEAAFGRFALLVGGLGKRVFIHRALWATTYRDEAGGEKEFEKVAYYQRSNDELLTRYDSLQATFPEARIIDVPMVHRVADPSHRWGLAPFHFVQTYYDHVRAELGI